MLDREFQVVQDPGFDETLSFTKNLRILPLVTKRGGCLRMFSRVTVHIIFKTNMIEVGLDSRDTRLGRATLF